METLDLQMLLANQADLAAFGELSLPTACGAANLDCSMVENTGVMIYDSKLYMAFSLQTDDAEIQRWQAALNQVKASPAFNEIVARYIHSPLVVTDCAAQSKPTASAMTPLRPAKLSCRPRQCESESAEAISVAPLAEINTIPMIEAPAINPRLPGQTQQSGSSTTPGRGQPGSSRQCYWQPETGHTQPSTRLAAQCNLKRLM